MKKKILVILPVLLLLCIVTANGEEKHKPLGRGIMIEIKFSSEVDGNLIRMTPKVLTMEHKQAMIKIGNMKSELNEKEVKADKELTEKKNFITTLELTPSVVRESKPAALKLDIKFFLNHNGVVYNENLTTTVLEGEPFLLERYDEKGKQKLCLEIRAQISEEKSDKGKIDVKVEKK